MLRAPFLTQIQLQYLKGPGTPAKRRSQAEAKRASGVCQARTLGAIIKTPCKGKHATELAGVSSHVPHDRRRWSHKCSTYQLPRGF